MFNLKDTLIKRQIDRKPGTDRFRFHVGALLCLALLFTGSVFQIKGFARQPYPAIHTGNRAVLGQVRQPARQESEGGVKVITGVEGSVVFINNIRHGTTDQSGELALPHVKAGSFPVKVRTPGYADFHGMITVVPGADRVLKVKQPPIHDEGLIDFQKAEALRDARKDEDAVKEYEEAIRLKPNLPEARIGLARVLISLERLDEAESQLREALRSLGPARAEATTVLANLRRTQGLYDESITDYKKAISLAHGVTPEAHIGLAIALEEKNDLDSAIKEYRAGIAQDMDTEPILYYLLGRALGKKGNQSDAIKAYQGYLRLDPEGQYSSAVASIIEKLKQESQQ
jgi:Flp pilus assembly protein TadD